MERWDGIRLYTVGHSTRQLDELVELLRSFGVGALADIRTIPRSRRNPQFDIRRLAVELPAAGIRYVHLARLGGLRHPRKDSPNTGWRNESFRGYADYMGTDAFEEGLLELREVAEDGVAAIMCAEAVPWRCHRSLVADVLTVRGARVEHILGPGHANPHQLTRFARVRDGSVIYPAPEA